MKRKFKKLDKNKRTDLASELIRAKKRVVNEVVSVVDFSIDEKTQRRLVKIRAGI